MDINFLKLEKGQIQFCDCIYTQLTCIPSLPGQGVLDPGQSLTPGASRACPGKWFSTCIWREGEVLVNESSQVDAEAGKEILRGVTTERSQDQGQVNWLLAQVA